MVLIGQKWLFSGKVAILGQSGCIRSKVIVFGLRLVYSGKEVVFGYSGCIQAKESVFVQK